jgi:hypothetical protein
LLEDGDGIGHQGAQGGDVGDGCHPVREHGG